MISTHSFHQYSDWMVNKLLVRSTKSCYCMIKFLFTVNLMCYLCSKKPSHPTQRVVFWWETQSMSKYWGLFWSTRDKPDYNPLCLMYILHELGNNSERCKSCIYTCKCQYINSKVYFVAHTLAFMKPWISPSFPYQQVWYNNVQQNC